MPYTLQFKRYSTVTMSTVTGAAGELIVDTTKDTVTVHDGATVGGFPLATEIFVTSAASSVITTVTGLLLSYTTNANLTSTLSSYALKTYADSAASTVSSYLVNYTQSINLTSTLQQYTLSSVLNSYTTNANLTSTLTSYPTNTNLTSTLTNYTQNASLTSTLAGYTTNVSLTSTLSSYTTKGPAFSAYPSSSVTQTITSGSQQKILFQNEEFDTNNNFASSRFTPNVAGYYQLNAVARISGTLGTGESMLVIWKNGSEYKRGSNASGTELGASFFAMQVSALVYANGTGDFFEVYIQQTSGGSRDITVAHSPGFGNITWFNGSMVRGA